MRAVRRIADASANLKKAKLYAFTYARPIFTLTNELPHRMLVISKSTIADLSLDCLGSFKLFD